MFPNHLKRKFLRLKINHYQTCTLCLKKQELTIPPFHLDLIQKFTDRSEEDVLAVLNKSCFNINKLSPEEIEARLKNLQNIELANRDKVRILPLLGLHHTTVKNRYYTLLEYGFRLDKIMASTLMRFVYFCQLPVERLKKFSYIEGNTDVIERLSRFADVDASILHLDLSESSSLKSLKVAFLIEFFKKYLDMKDEDFSQEGKNRSVKRMKNKSFQVLHRNLEIAMKILEMSKERVRNNMFVLASDPDNTLEIMNRFKELGGVDIRVCLRAYPKILAMTVDNMHKITEHIEEFGVKKDAVRRFIQTYTLNSDTVRQRLEQLDLIDPYKVFRKHPKVLGLVFLQNKIQRRLRLLQEMDINHVSLHAITAGQQIFERLIDGREPSGRDSVHLVTSELGMDKTELRQKLRRRPYWHLVPLVEIVKNLKLLRETFTNQQIIDNVYILFYPSEAVSRELSQLDKKEGLESCLSESGGRILQKYRLPALLYYLEKQTEFAGHSIWGIPSEPQPHDIYQDLPDPKKLTSTRNNY